MGFFVLFCFDYSNVRVEFVHQQEDLNVRFYVVHLEPP